MELSLDEQEPPQMTRQTVGDTNHASLEALMVQE